MSQPGGASLEEPASETSQSGSDDLTEALAAVSDDTDITKTLSGTIHYDPDGGERETIGTDATVAVTEKAVHVLSDGSDTESDAIRTVPLMEVSDAQSSGLVRRKLTITAANGTYELRPDGRPDLGATAQFLRRASWSWRRVAPRLETAREAITALEDDLEVEGPERLEREKHQAKMALSKAQSGASRLDVAVDAIEREIERLRQRLREQQIRWHIMRGEAARETAEYQRDSGVVHAARDAFEDARDHYQEALSIAKESDDTGTKQIRMRLEEARAALYDLEVDPAVEAYEAVEQAMEADEPASARDAWETAAEHYRQALDEDSEQPHIHFQLAWIDANYVRACRAYASELESEADEHVANGHEQWARELYMAAHDQLTAALEAARERDGCPTAPIESHHERLVEKHSSGGYEWQTAEASSD